MFYRQNILGLKVSVSIRSRDSTFERSRSRVSKSPLHPYELPPVTREKKRHRPRDCLISLRASLNTGYITCTLHDITNPASSLSFSNNIIVVVVVVVNVIVKVFDVKSGKSATTGRRERLTILQTV